MRKYVFFLVLFLLGSSGWSYALHNSFEISNSDQLARISEKPIFEPAPNAIAMGSQDIASLVTPLIQCYLEEKNYDRLHLQEQFIDEYLSRQKKGSTESLLETLADFTADRGTARNSGGTCYSLTADLLDLLPVELSGYVVGATIPARFKQKGQAFVSHSAIAIKYCNPEDFNDSGVVLIDPSFDIEVPVILKHDRKLFSLDAKTKGIWQFMLLEDKVLCFTDPIDYSIPRIESATMVYNLQHYMNPFEVDLKPLIAADRRPVIISRDKLGFYNAFIILYLETNSILLQLSGKNQLIVSFQDFLKSDSFSEEVANIFQTTSSALNNSVRKIILHKEILNCLHKDYLDLIYQSTRTADFYLEEYLPLSHRDQ